MITPVDVPQLILAACPSFAAKWPQVEADSADGTERLLCLDAGDFIRHIVELHQQKQTTEFDGIFSAIERMVTSGDEYVSNLGVIGYLEGLQTASVTSAGIDPEVEFRPRLGPVSERWWDRTTASGPVMRRRSRRTSHSPTPDTPNRTSSLSWFSSGRSGQPAAPDTHSRQGHWTWCCTPQWSVQRPHRC